MKDKQPVVIAVHGVGSPVQGEICGAIKRTLRANGFSAPCTEVNWNSIVEQPVRDGRLQDVAVRNLGNALAAVSLGGVYLRSRNTRLHPLLGNFCEVSFACAELAEFATFICFSVIAPIIYVLALAIQMEIDSPLYLWGYWHVLLSISSLAFIIALISYVLGSLVISVLSRASSSAMESIRRSAFLLVRPIVVCVAAPFILPWREVNRFRGSTAYRLVLLAGLVIGFIAFAFHRNSDLSQHPVLNEAVWMSSVLCLVPLVSVVVVTLMQYVLGPGLKVLLDIACYAGDSDYRARIQRFMDKKVEEARSNHWNGEVVLVGHSLGSVIAVDSLCNSAVWSRRDRVTLITCGSPLRRFFFRFFPNHLFPEGARDCSTLIASRLAGFRWLNCYRPWDQVGTRLNLPKEAWASEHSTEQNSKLFSAHINYWSDGTAVRVVLAGLRQLKTHIADPASPWTPSPLAKAEYRPSALRLVKRFALIGYMCVPLLSACVELRVHVLRQADASRLYTRIMSEGAQAAGVIKWSCSEVETGVYGIGAPSYEISIEYYDSSERLHTNHYSLGADLGLSPSIYVFDERRLEASFHAICSVIEQQGTTNVRVRYLRDRPDVFLMPDFPPRLGRFWDVALEALRLTIIALILGPLATYASMYWLRLFLGTAS